MIISYDLGLYYGDTPATVEVHTEGGTYEVGGTNKAELNIAYNYANFYYKYIDEKRGIRWLYGKKAFETISRLEKAIKKLGTKRDNNYWKSTKGNAGYALSILLNWAKQHPGAIWSGD